MQKINTLLLLVIFFSSCTLQQMQKLAKEQELTVKPSPLELHGDSVRFSTEAILPVKMLRPKTSYSLDVNYEPVNNNPIKVGNLLFLGDNYPNTTMNPRITQNFSFAYTEDLKKGAVTIQGSVTKGTKFLETDKLEIAKGIITTSLLVQPVFYSMGIESNFKNPDEFESKKFDFFFKVGSSKLYMKSQKEQAKELEEFIGSYAASVRNINIMGMHSPEGPTEINAELSEKRPKEVRNFFESLMKQYQYDTLQINDFTVTPVVEDWLAFKTLLETDETLNEQEKTEILDILNGEGDFVSKEKSLRTLSSYRKLIDTLYPPLRNSKIELVRVKEKLSDAEILVYAKQIAKGEKEAGELKAIQLFYAADLTPDDDEKLSFYQVYVENFSDHKAEVYNNIAHILLKKAKKTEKNSEKFTELLNKATEMLNKSLETKELQEVYVALAGVQLMKGELENSKNTLKKISKPKDKKIDFFVNNLKSYFHIKKAEYDQAIQLLSLNTEKQDVPAQFNKALAILLQSSYKMRHDQYQRIFTAFENVIKKDDKYPLAHYGMAINMMRNNDIENTLSYLSKAISLDSTLKSYLANDYEFISLFENTEFKKLLM